MTSTSSTYTPDPNRASAGRPQKFAGKVDLKNLDMSVFGEVRAPEDKLVYKMYTAVVWAVSPSARDGSLSRIHQNTAAQRCNGGSIYCNVRETCELAIK